jgi:hypothetical protein
LRHLAPFARQIAGQQAIPSASIEARIRPRHRPHRARPRSRVAQDGGQGSESQ